MRELPALEKISKEFARYGLRVVGITADDAKGTAATVKRLGISFPVLLDEKYQALLKFHLEATPRTLLIDKQGIVRADVYGALTEDELRNELKQVGLKKD